MNAPQANISRVTSPCRLVEPLSSDAVWLQLMDEARDAAVNEPALASYLSAVILSHRNLAEALAYHLAQKLGGPDMNALQIRDICEAAYNAQPCLVEWAAADLRAVMTRDPAAKSLLQPILYFKGFSALQAHRVAHELWGHDRDTLAWFLQNRVSELLQVDIHPAAKIGSGVFMDHATGIVIGETAVVGDNVSMLHNVTLGGTGKENGDRHPKIGDNVLIGAGAHVLGNIKIGNGARIAAGSVVLHPVQAGCTVAGIPAVVVGRCCDNPADAMDHVFDVATFDPGI